MSKPLKMGLIVGKDFFSVFFYTLKEVLSPNTYFKFTIYLH